MKKKTNPGLKIICLNRKASFNYFFIDLLEAGIVLRGSEIKSVRNGIKKKVFLPAPEGSWYCSEKWCSFWNTFFFLYIYIHKQ